MSYLRAIWHYLTHSDHSDQTGIQTIKDLVQ